MNVWVPIPTVQRTVGIGTSQAGRQLDGVKEDV